MVQRGLFSVGMAVVVSMMVATLAAGCGDKGGGPGSDGSDAWRQSTDPVTTSGLAWAAESTVHLSDGTTIDTGGYVSVFLVAGDGVFFVPAESEDDAGSALFAEQELQFAAPGKAATGTGLFVSDDYVAASPDGRFLAAIDTTSGDKDKYGTPQATVVAFDLQTGEQVVDSTLGMGDPDKDDFADLYSELEMNIVAATDEELHVDTSSHIVFDLTTGEGRELAEAPPQVTPEDELTSPNGEWRIELPEEGRVRIRGSDGAEVRLNTAGPRWNLYWWADDNTAVGTYITGPNKGNRTEPGDTSVLMTCQVPSGECEVYEDTAGKTVVFPYDASEGNGIILQKGDES